MVTFLINFLLGTCRHRHQSRPFTLDNHTYKVCLDCGKEIGYSLESMAPLRLGEQREFKIAGAERPSRTGHRSHSPETRCEEISNQRAALKAERTGPTVRHERQAERTEPHTGPMNCIYGKRGTANALRLRLYDLTA
jgi:hypothetical protein